MRRVCQAVTDLPMPHVCARPRVPSRVPDEALPAPGPDAHAQAANAALGDAEPAEPCPGAVPSSVLTDAAGDAVAEVSSSPSESPAVIAVTVSCEPHSPSPIAGVVEMADESGSALIAAAARQQLAPNKCRRPRPRRRLATQVA